MFKNALAKVQEEGGNLLCGGDILEGAGYESGSYVTPAIVEAQNSYEINSYTIMCRLIINMLSNNNMSFNIHNMPMH